MRSEEGNREGRAGEHMNLKISIGSQDFAFLREHNCFFSRQYEHRGDLFEGLNIWSDLKYRNIQGSYPVIYLSFADVKQDCYGDTVYDQN